ncbi:hypothetical protein ACHWQZ_G005071 [Mnemiopsis leidyi]
MKGSKPLVVRYCPYKPLPYNRSDKRSRSHRKPVLNDPRENLTCNFNPLLARDAKIDSPEKKQKVQLFSPDLISETLKTIGNLYPTNTNTRVHWDLPTTLEPLTCHPLHNVTLVTTPKHSHDDLSDVLEEVLDLWAALHKSNRNHGNSDQDRCPITATLNEE